MGCWRHARAEADHSQLPPESFMNVPKFRQSPLRVTFHQHGQALKHYDQPNLPSFTFCCNRSNIGG